MTKNGFNRLIIEKPFGSDYQSAFELNQQIREVFPEQDIFRIDHYLGKEMIKTSQLSVLPIIFLRLNGTIAISTISKLLLAKNLGVEDRGATTIIVAHLKTWCKIIFYRL